MMIIDGQSVDDTPPVPTIGTIVHAVPKVAIVDRLIKVGLLKTAYEALKFDAPASSLSDADFALRERWNAASEIMSDDEDALALLTGIGADPAVILAL